MKHLGSTARAAAALAAVAALALPAGAHAQQTVTGGLTLLSPTPIGATGGGLGNQLTILTLQSPGSSTTETGCVTPSGPGTVGTCGFADANVQQGQSQTQFIAGITGQTLRLGFNATEPSNALSTTLNSLVLTLYSGNTALLNISTAGVPLTLTNTLNGIGNFGFEFGLTAAAASAFNSFLGQSNLSIGVGASLSDVTGGLETFNLAVGPAQGGGGGAGSVVPEPSTYVLLASGMLGMAGVARRRRRQG